jgi:hypothetical protein
MNDVSDQKLDELLRRDFAGAVADDGFSAQVMRALPPRRRQRTKLLPIAALIGGLPACLALLPSTLLQQATNEWLTADICSAFVVVCVLLLGVSLLGCSWALEETP